MLQSCRLVHDLSQVEDSLSFWSNKLRQDSGHFRFLLLGQGPVAFAHAMQAFVQRNADQMRDSASAKIERRVSAQGAVQRACLQIFLYAGSILPPTDHASA